MEFEKPYSDKKFVSPSPMAFVLNREQSYPEAAGLHRDKSRLNQTRMDTKTLLWGEGDSLPLRILKAVSESPTASSCLGKVEKFIRGSAFSDTALMGLKIDERGTTLWELHSFICQYMSLLEGFAVNHQPNEDGKTVNAYGMSMECLRFKKESEETTEINCFIYNPYFGTAEYVNYQNDEYPFFNPEKASDEALIYGDKYKGQVYFYGRVRPLYKFYPVPKYWSGEHWIYVDGQIQAFHKNNLSNGFFQSALLNVIGDPNEWSQDPRYVTKVKGTDGIERDQPTKTVGEVFNEEMAKTFSGVNKAGSVMTMWSLNEQQYVKVSAFPVNTSFDVMSGTFTDAVRGITIATEVPAILANLPQQQNSLGSDGNAIRAAIELMNANAKDAQNILENYYNNILLPNHVNGKPGMKVEIIPYSPITVQTPVDKQFWDWMNDQERARYITDNVPTIKIIRTPAAAPVDPNAPIDPNAPPTPAPAQVDDNLKSMKISEINKISSIVKKYEKGQLTLEQAKQFLQGYGLSEEQITAWLI